MSFCVAARNYQVETYRSDLHDPIPKRVLHPWRDLVFASGCTDLKPAQAQIDDMKSQLREIAPNIASADSQAMAAAETARTAASTAQQAQSTADKANAMAQNNQQAIEAINEKIDRMFKKSVSK